LLLKRAEAVEEFYIQHCVPRKAQLNLEYAKRANLLSDTWIILQTICPYWITLLVVYGLVLAGAFWLSCQLIYESAPPRRLREDFTGTMLAIVAVQLGALIWRRQCKGLLSYFSLPELRQLVLALGFACLLVLGLSAAADQGWPPPNLVLVDAVVSLCALGGLRLALRFWRENSDKEGAASEAPLLRVGIIGAGRTGSQLAHELMTGKQFGRMIVAFFDDDFRKWHRCLHEIPVVGMPECLLEGWASELDEVIIALPDAPASRIGEIRSLLQAVGLKTYTARSARSHWFGDVERALEENDL
jgi:FlaA1/EpsC-like NDP-sugar epimerase